jgi:hypothetical protein
MADLVEVARFLDLTEAQSAAAALRASGMPVFLQNENYGQTEAYLQLALGGFILFAPESEAADARAFIVHSRREFTPARPEPEADRLTFGLAAVAAIFAPALGYLFAPFARRPLPDDPDGNFPEFTDR